VPAEVCPNRSEDHLDESAAATAPARAGQAAREGAAVEIREHAAA
jgi:hypothetical protein